MLTIFGLLLFMAGNGNAAEYYVSPSGDDGAPGTKDQPFRTVQKAADVMVAGDTCFIRGGTYRETVTPKNSGEEGKPIRFVACPGELVTLSGTEPLTCKWEVHKGSIYKTKVDRDFEQLFVDGRMMVEARWPNMPFEELWNRDTWASATKGSGYGKIVDPELAKVKIDFTGALAHLNVAHQFYTWTRFVKSHKPGDDFFEYPQTLGRDIPIRYGNSPWPWINDRYYFSGVLAALDAPTEWFLDSKTKTLYLWAKDGADPTGRAIEVKARDYAFQAEEKDYIEIKGIHFFGAALQFLKCNDCLVENCHLLFPVYTRELLEHCQKPKKRNTPKTLLYGDRNVVRNCSLGYASTAGLVMRGNNTLVENCVVHDICWDGSLRYVPISVAANRKTDQPGGTVRRCTVFNFGNAGICFRSRPATIEYNHVYNGGLTCKDVALIYTGGPYCADSVVHHNWVHGCRTEDGAGLGIRGDDQTRKLTAHHNVVWDCGRDGIIIKGDNNRVDNNTCLFMGTKEIPGNFIALPTRAEPVKPWRRQFPLLERQNQNSEVFNNVARTIVCNQGNRESFPPGKQLSNNYTGETPDLVDAQNLDFRPKKGSPLIDAGREIPGFTDGFKGKAPDIGAYEFGGEYWKPGHHNGVWVARANDTLRVALTMPIFEAKDVDMTSRDGNLAIRLQFTPENWMQPQETKLTASVPLRFNAGSWGTVEIAEVTPMGATGWFPEPDIRKDRPIDYRFNTLHFPRPHSGEPRHALRPAARAFRINTPIQIDGQVGEAEWPGWTPFHTLPLCPLADREKQADRTGEALALFDSENLYIAFRIREKNAPMLGDRWGETDGVEVDLQAVLGSKLGPVFVLHGFPSGRMESVTDAGATAVQAADLAKQVKFSARVNGNAWDAEFRIPFAALGMDAKSSEPIRFNVGARVGGEWFAWAKTGKANYAVDQAGTLALAPALPVTARNLLRNGDFESEDLTPWRKANNTGTVPDAMVVQRVQEGPDGGWCMKIECQDANLMKKGVLKWLHALGQDAGPGTYVLSYDMRVQGLKPRGSMGSFNSYIRTSTGPKTGGNVGQREAAFSGSDLPWTRRDCVITIDKDARPTFVSLQLHKATGTVWIDNVSLLQCEPPAKETK